MTERSVFRTGILTFRPGPVNVLPSLLEVSFPSCSLIDQLLKLAFFLAQSL